MCGLRRAAQRVAHIHAFYNSGFKLKEKLQSKLHRFFPLVLTKLIFIIFFTFLNTFLQEGYFLTNFEENDAREVL
jgi:hypothetical protein